jgi:hypothetical protein
MTESVKRRAENKRIKVNIGRLTEGISRIGSLQCGP